MLVLSRKVGEKLLVGPDVVVTITQIRGDKVRIGVEAPREVRVVREEIEADGKPRSFTIEAPSEKWRNA